MPPITKNKAIMALNDIDQLVQRYCSGINTDNEQDRAKLAWWIFQTFVNGDFRNLGIQKPANEKQ